MCYKLQAAFFFQDVHFFTRLHTRTMRLFKQISWMYKQNLQFAAGSLFTLEWVECGVLAEPLAAHRRGLRWISGRLIWLLCSLKKSHQHREIPQPQRDGRRGHCGSSRVNLSLPVTQSEARMALKLSEWIKEETFLVVWRCVMGLVFPADWACSWKDSVSCPVCTVSAALGALLTYHPSHAASTDNQAIKSLSEHQIQICCCALFKTTPALAG